MADQNTVLLVLPDANVRAQIAAALRQAGIPVTEAGCGTEALVLARRFTPSLALVDSDLPDVHYLELISRLKEVCPNIAHLTSSGGCVSREQAALYGVDTHPASSLDPGSLIPLFREESVLASEDARLPSRASDVGDAAAGDALSSLVDAVAEVSGAADLPAACMAVLLRILEMVGSSRGVVALKGQDDVRIPAASGVDAEGISAIVRTAFRRWDELAADEPFVLQDYLAIPLPFGQDRSVVVLAGVTPQASAAAIDGAVRRFVRIVAPMLVRFAGLTRLRSRLERSSVELQKLRFTKEVVSDAKEHWDSAQRMLENIRELAQAADCVLFSMDGDTMRVVGHTNRSLTIPIGVGVHRSDSVAWRVLDSGTPLFLSNIRQDGLKLDKLAAAKGNLESILYTPLTYRGLKLGVLAMGFSDETCRGPDDSARHSLDALAAQAALVLDGMRLVEESAKRAAEIDAQNERLAATLSAIPGVILIYDAEGRTVTTNPVGSSVMMSEFGSWVDVFNSRGLVQIIRPDGTPYTAEELPSVRSVTAGEHVWGEEMVLTLPSGHTAAVIVNSAPILSPDGSISGGVTIVQDISCLREAYCRLEENLGREQKVTNHLQKAFLPADIPQIEGLEIVSKYVPALEEPRVGGDFYDVFEFPGGKIGVVMADVSGKGLSAAVYTAMTKYVLKAYACEDPTPSLVVERLNRCLCAEMPEDYFVTLFYALVDVEERTFTYVDAGHEYPLLLKSSVGCSVPLAVTGRALGIVEESTFSSESQRLESGDLLLLYTDGLTDSRQADGFLGLEGLMQHVDRLAGSPAQVVVDTLWQSLGLDQTERLRDDIAILCIRAV